MITRWANTWWGWRSIKLTLRVRYVDRRDNRVQVKSTKCGCWIFMTILWYNWDDIVLSDTGAVHNFRHLRCSLIHVTKRPNLVCNSADLQCNQKLIKWPSHNVQCPIDSQTKACFLPALNLSKSFHRWSLCSHRCRYSPRDHHRTWHLDRFQFSFCCFKVENITGRVFVEDWLTLTVEARMIRSLMKTNKARGKQVFLNRSHFLFIHVINFFLQFCFWVFEHVTQLASQYFPTGILWDDVNEL